MQGVRKVRGGRKEERGERRNEEEGVMRRNKEEGETRMGRKELREGFKKMKIEKDASLTARSRNSRLMKLVCLNRKWQKNRPIFLA